MTEQSGLEPDAHQPERDPAEPEVATRDWFSHGIIETGGDGVHLHVVADVAQWTTLAMMSGLIGNIFTDVAKGVVTKVVHRGTAPVENRSQVLAAA